MPIRFVILPLLFISLAAFPQNAPVTTAGTVTSAVPGTIDIAITASGFSDIGSVYLSLDYDHSVAQLTGATPHPQMPTFLYGDNDLGTGYHRVTMGWYGNGLSLPDNSTIMTLHFTYAEGNTGLIFYDNGPSCQYANGAGQGLNDLPYEDYYVNGSLCGAVENPGPIAGAVEVCAGQQTVSYSVTPMANASGYAWTVSPEAVIAAGQGTNLVVADFTGAAGTVNFTVQAYNACGILSPPATLAVTVNNLPVAYAVTPAPIPYGTSATLTAFVEPGSFAFHWSPEALFTDPYVQNPQTVNLFASQLVSFRATSLETGCESGNEIVAAVAGGPLTVNPAASPETVCAGAQSIVRALVSGGTGNYSYSWTSHPPGWTSALPVDTILPMVTTTLYLAVSDGDSTVTDSLAVFVEDAVTAAISGVDTLCGSGGSTTLAVDLTGTPPWDFVYTFTNRSVMVTGVESTPYDLVTGEAGAYTISLVNSAYCGGTGQGEGLVARYPIPPAPVIELIETTLVSNACCGNQWYRNDVAIPGATGVGYTATESGKYYDIVTRFSCVSDTSNVIHVVIPGIPEIPGVEAVIYPNPARDFLVIRLAERINGNITVSLMTLPGALLHSETFPAGPCGEYRISTAHLPAGFYLVRILTPISHQTHPLLLMN